MAASLVFSADDSLYPRSLFLYEPGSAGPVPLSDVAAYYDGVSAGRFVAYSGFSLANGVEPFVTYGSPAGTFQLADINPSLDGSNPLDFQAVGDRVFFRARSPELGSELWVTDGTAAGTRLVRELAPGPESGVASSLDTSPRIDFNGRLLFTPFESKWMGGPEHAELWVSDGTEAGTVRVAAFDHSPFGETIELYEAATTGERTFFSAYDATNGHALWVTDGTAAGTRLVCDVSASMDQRPNSITVLDGIAYFTASDYPSGRELWRSDGTAAGTEIVVDLTPLSAMDSNPTNLTVLNGRLLFGARGAQGYELYTSDGTAAGTSILKDIRPGGDSFTGNLGVFADNTRAVFVANNNTTGGELWVTDGTADGTRLLKDIRPAANFSVPWTFFDGGDVVYFHVANSAGSADLWMSDGTAEGTGLVREFGQSEGFFLVGTIEGNAAPTSITLSVASVRENAAAGTVVGDLSALDPDGDALSFSIADDAAGRFRIEGSQLVVDGPIDFEATPTLRVEVTATDLGGASVRAALTIAVIDAGTPTEGDDEVAGTGARDRIDALAGDDEVLGLGGKDRLLGGEGDDRLDGGKGKDLLLGGKGDDVLIGGAGADVFDFNGKTGRDVVEDFGRGRDRIDLSQGGTTFDDLVLKAASRGDDTLVKLGKDTFLLVGVAVSEVTADLFDFG